MLPGTAPGEPTGAEQSWLPRIATPWPFSAAARKEVVSADRMGSWKRLQSLPS